MRSQRVKKKENKKKHDLQTVATWLLHEKIFKFKALQNIAIARFISIKPEVSPEYINIFNRLRTLEVS